MNMCRYHNRPALDQRLGARDGRCVGDPRDDDGEGCLTDVRIREKKVRQHDKRR